MINKSINELNTVWQGLSEKLYQQTKTDNPSSPEEDGANEPSSKKNDEVEEADFEEVK